MYLLGSRSPRLLGESNRVKSSVLTLLYLPSTKSYDSKTTKQRDVICLLCGRKHKKKIRVLVVLPTV